MDWASRVSAALIPSPSNPVALAAERKGHGRIQGQPCRSSGACVTESFYKC